MAEKKLNLAQTLEKLRTGKAPVAIGTISDLDFTVNAVSTGNVTLDALTSIDGMPRGRIIELFGPPSSGKTTCALQTAATVLAAGGKVLFLDYEKSLDPVYCEALGIKPDDPNFIVMRPKSFEEGANIFRELCKTGELDLMIADSVAAMVTENELAAETGKATMADRAKMMHQFCRQIVELLASTDTCVIFLNHVLEVVDTSPMGQQLKARGIQRKTTPGGAALKFYSSLRMEFKQVGNIRSTRYNPITNANEDVIAQTKVQATVVKNKVGDPFRTAELRVRQGLGFSQAYSVVDVLIAHRVIRVEKGGVHRFTATAQPEGRDEMPYVRGEDTLLGMLESDPEWLGQLTALAKSLLAEHGTEVVDGSKYDQDGEEITADVDDILSVDKETGEIL